MEDSGRVLLLFRAIFESLKEGGTISRKNRKKHQARAQSSVNEMKNAAAKYTTAAIREAYKDSGYSESGASCTKRSLKGWTADSRSPVEDIDMNLFTLRQRSRSLYMGSPIARSAIDTNLLNVVGAGLKCKPRPDAEFLGLSREEAQNWEKHVLREFMLWADSKYCDTTKINNFDENQGLMLTSWLLNGDGIALIDSAPPAPYMPYSLRIHIIESDRITNPDTTAFSGLEGQVWYNTQNGNPVYDGVEIDKDSGAVEAYYVCNFYPNSFIPTVKQRKWTRIQAFDKQTGLQNVIHVMYSERAEQYRGVPLLAPVIDSLKQLTRYIDAETVAAVINGFFTGFITTASPTNDNPMQSPIPDSERVDRSEGTYELGPGTMNRLAPGENVQIADPKRPSQNFDAFVTSMARYIGAAVGVPYELLLKSFNSSYSASRASLLEAWKGFRTRRTWFAKDFCQPVYELWLAEAVARGRVSAPGFFDDPIVRKAWSKAEWNGPSQGQLDPLKEVMASEHLVKNGFSTYQRETTELQGGDFDANAEENARDSAVLKEANDIFNPAATTAVSTKPNPDSAQQDLSQNENTGKGGKSL